MEACPYMCYGAIVTGTHPITGEDEVMPCEAVPRWFSLVNGGQYACDVHRSELQGAVFPWRGEQSEFDSRVGGSGSQERRVRDQPNSKIRFSSLSLKDVTCSCGHHKARHKGDLLECMEGCGCKEFRKVPNP